MTHFKWVMLGHRKDSHCHLVSLIGPDWNPGVMTPLSKDTCCGCRSPERHLSSPEQQPIFTPRRLAHFRAISAIGSLSRPRSSQDRKDQRIL